MAGAVIVLIVMVLVGPILVMLGGALWSAAIGWFLVEDAEEHATELEAANADG